MVAVMAKQNPVTIQGVAKRLTAVRKHIGLDRTPFAAWLGVNRTAYFNWEAGVKGNFPAEEAMARLCELVPSLTLDYIYRGKMSFLKDDLALRLAAFEAGDDPNTPGFDLDRYRGDVAARR